MNKNYGAAPVVTTGWPINMEQPIRDFITSLHNLGYKMTYSYHKLYAKEKISNVIKLNGRSYTNQQPNRCRLMGMIFYDDGQMFGYSKHSWFKPGWYIGVDSAHLYNKPQQCSLYTKIEEDGSNWQLLIDTMEFLSSVEYDRFEKHVNTSLNPLVKLNTYRIYTFDQYDTELVKIIKNFKVDRIYKSDQYDTELVEIIKNFKVKSETEVV